jgi:ABC-2 type transport system permease protein
MKELWDTLLQVLAVAWKDLSVFAKDRGELIVLFLLPVLLSAMVGSMYNQMFQPEESDVLFPVYVVNQDSGPFGQQVVAALNTIDQLDVEALDSVTQADEGVSAGERIAAVVIPAGFTDNLNAYEPSTVQVIVDPGQEEAGSLITGLVNQIVAPLTTMGEIQYGIRTILDEAGVLDQADPQMVRAALAQGVGAMMTQLQEMEQNPAIMVASEDSEGAAVTVPDNAYAVWMPAFAVWFAFFVVGSVAGTLLQEREEGTLRRLVAAPIPGGAVIAGKMLAYGLIAVLQVLVIFAVGNIAFGMSLGNSPLGLVLITLGLALAATSLGMMIAGLSRTSRQAYLIGLVLGFVLAGLGGCLSFNPLEPMFRMEGIFGILSKLTPHSHGLEAYRRLLVDQGGVVDVLPQFGILVLMSAILFLVARWRFKFE